MDDPWNPLRRLRRRAGALVSVAHAWKRTLRDTIVDVRVVEGACRHGGGTLRVLCVGRVGRVPFLTDALLAPGAHIGDTRRIALWRVADMLGRSEGRECDLMLAAVPPWSWAGLGGPESYLVPDWIEGETDLAAFLLAPPHPSRADDLRRVRRHGLTPRVVHRPNDIREFYERMHVPFVGRQHGPLAETMPLKEMTRRFRDADLLLVEHDDGSIAGGGIDFSGTTPRLFGLGVREPIGRHMAMGAVAAVYEFCFEHLAARACPRLGLGYTRPLLDDGVLRYKRKWGQRICRAYDQKTLLRVLRHGPAVDAFLTNTPFIHVTPTGLRGAVFTATVDVPDTRPATLVRRWKIDGLEDVTLHPLDGAPIRSLFDRSANRTAQAAVVPPGLTADGTRPARVAGRRSRADIDLATATFLGELVGFQRGESMVACVDETTGEDLVESIRAGVESRGGSFHAVTTSRADPPASAARAVVDGARLYSGRIVCEMGGRTLYQTVAWDESIALGARVYSLAQLDAAAFIRCVAGVDHAALLRFGEALHGILSRGRRVAIRTANGTDLSMHTRQDRWHRILNRVTRRRDAWTWRPTGMLVDGVSASFLGGQISFRPELDSLHGVAVNDGFLWPPREGGRLDRPVTWTFRRGALAAVHAPPALGASLGRHLGEGPTFLEHFSIGYHPRATLTGELHEAERLSGALVVGIGWGACHTDGVMTEASVEVDGVPLLDRGRFVHPLLPDPNPTA